MKIAKIAGITVRINYFLLVIVGLYAYLGLAEEIIIVFSAVFLHEIAHTLVALSLGIRVTVIELFPFGGQALVEDLMILEPGKEIWIALAGPVFSFSLAAFFFGGPFDDNPMLDLFINTNLALGLFNCLPALPLDGGRVFRAVLSNRTGYRKATKYSVLVGKTTALAIVLGAAYKYYRDGEINSNFILIGIFLFWAAHKEGKYLAYAFMRLIIRKKSQLALKGFLASKQVVSSSNTKVSKILSSLSPNYYTLVAEVDKNHNVIVIHSEIVLIEAIIEKGPQVTLGDC